MKSETMVHIVDDDEAVRDALSFLMQSEDIPCKSYASAEEFLETYVHTHCECLLLDVRMPGLTGLELLDELNSRQIKIPVIFITGHGDISMAVQAMKEGAADFIEKPFNNERLLESVRQCLTDSITNNAASENKQAALKLLSTLTKRERQVMDLLVEGKQNKVIAQELGISHRTVELHRAKVMGKLSAHSLSNVVRIALAAGEQS